MWFLKNDWFWTKTLKSINHGFFYLFLNSNTIESKHCKIHAGTNFKVEKGASWGSLVWRKSTKSTQINPLFLLWLPSFAKLALLKIIIIYILKSSYLVLITKYGMLTSLLVVTLSGNFHKIFFTMSGDSIWYYYLLDFYHGADCQNEFKQKLGSQAKAFSNGEYWCPEVQKNKK